MQILVVFIASSTIALFLSLIHIILNPTTSPDENVIDFWAPTLFPLIWHIIRNPSSAHRYIDVRKAHVSQLLRKVERRKEFFATFLEKIILNLSDQLLLTDSAILIVGSLRLWPISVYHFAIIGDLAWFTPNVHLITLRVFFAIPARLANPPQLAGLVYELHGDLIYCIHHYTRAPRLVYQWAIRCTMCVR